MSKEGSPALGVSLGGRLRTGPQAKLYIGTMAKQERHLSNGERQEGLLRRRYMVSKTLPSVGGAGESEGT